jgi:hypothetical protein
MRSRIPRHIRYLTVLILLLVAVGALTQTTGAVVGAVGLPLGASRACGCKAPAVELKNPTELNFGKVTINSEKTVGFIFENKTDKVKYVKEEVVNTKGSAFVKGAENCVTNTIEAPGMCEIQVEFRPTVNGEKYLGDLKVEYKDLTTGGNSVEMNELIEGEGKP